ncbi:MAG: DUF305 domain-containing protein [Microbacterium sp. 67-17]|nr:DUF305 domain-containing protein [Microbacterium sp. 67-17]OJV96465.1 MAG: DUF305 domain-containing protein [Microbacterium sp. 67-17]
MKNRPATSAAIALTLALAVTGCASVTGSGPGASSAPSSASASAFNATDVMFVQMMIPHHAQAIEMSDTLLAKDGVDADVRELAENIKAAQQPEIDTMEGWLTAWGAEMPGAGGMAGMGHDNGMMSDDDMSTLAAASGPDASRLFLEQMIVHHEGAIEMAQDELDSGSSPDVRELAEAIIIAQTAEIATMRTLLAEF